MTEVDVVLPEGVAEPTNKLLAKGATTTVTTKEQEEDNSSSEEQPESEQLEKAEPEHELEAEPDEVLEAVELATGKQQAEADAALLAKKANILGDESVAIDDDVVDEPTKPEAAEEEEDEAMEVDEADAQLEAKTTDESEECDSQLTSDSSTENGTSTSKGTPVEGEGDTEEDDEESEEATTNGDHDELDAEKIGSTAENSCDAEDPLGAVTQPDTESEESLLKQKSSPVEEEEPEEETNTAKTLSDSEPEAEPVKQQNGFTPSPATDEDEQQQQNTAAVPEMAKSNGLANAAEEANNTKPMSVSEGVVNLDEDSDEDMPEAKQKVSGTESSDDAVLIPSDSESEAAAPPSASKKVAPTPIAAAPPAPAPALDDDDDDDDDCVVIEDDTPPNSSPSLHKRKGDFDDMQHNSKRQRSGTPSGLIIGGGGLGQLTIKDARSLMPQDLATAGGAGIYPVTITNAVTGLATNLGNVPPKLVPMAGLNAAVLTQPLNPPTLGLPSMTNNANLLPGLTDDMFVLEAPSFIVPYIYEKPPNENIREVIKSIETTYGLSPEDLAATDRVDEFDMMTEQNKEGKPNAGDEQSGKKKKKRGDDESWSEQSDDDDDDEDDEDSEGGVRTKVLIKEANDDLTALKGAIKPAAALAASTNAVSKPGQENYFESPLGKFFMDIGVGLVQEYVQADLLRLQKRKMRKSLTRDPKDFEMAINALSGNLQASKTKNAPFKFTMKRCEFCNFKSESALSMANHYETPHMNGVLYKCNFCTFEIRNATEIVYHMEAVHNIKARLIKPLPYHQCPNCGFEDNGKAKLARHQPVCAKKFRPELNLAPPNDWEAPAKIPRIKPRHGLVGTATAYQAMAAQAAAQKAALATIQQQQAAAQARNLQAAALAAQNAAKMRQRAPQLPKVQLPTANSMLRNPSPVRGANNASLALPNSYQLAAGQLVQQASKKPIAGQPSISITPLPRQSASVSGAGAGASSSKMPQTAPAGMKPGQNPSGGNNKAQFVICEICDGYIKDLEQLRNHMQWMHKVKIHPKMIYNRPPLNCQKCQFRFFTDQGLERHLLGSHGLVTSSMQEAANKGKDAGRCPVCGRMYQWKLLNHVSRDHHMTLKPAHLSYKCTVCTATFGMYKQFETHVYTAHSTVARKAMDSKKNSAAQSSSSGSNRSALSSANDSLLKPLKINDEITIIPQPASKPRITNMESHVID
ncbi:uncharacterized protein LOC108600315 [Drosophila busckii]|uniref:uncharacterized protein LOC108600315 n=1 Tax=Drosophila busckii TaxID=30019 RepID=UPI00083F10AF|nr:uncharacterized protein LOC108600315 [Drosophila busckii]